MGAQASAPNGTRLSSCGVPKAVRLSYRSSRTAAQSSLEELPTFRTSQASTISENFQSTSPAWDQQDVPARRPG